MQRCIDCQFCKWCKEVLIETRIVSSFGTIAEITKKLSKQDKTKFNNYYCFRRKI